MASAVGEFLEVGDRCLICCSGERRILSLVGRKLDKLTTVICTGCGLIHSHPIPTTDELAQYYSESYRIRYKHTYKPRLKHVYRYARGAYDRIVHISEYSCGERKKLIDVGAGSGEFLYMASKSGYDVVGIEPNSAYAVYIRERLGLPVISRTYEDAGFENESCNVINLNHVLEHLGDPLAALCRFNEMLVQDGIIAVSVPDIEFQNHVPWTRFHFAHVYNFNSTTLAALLMKSGFRVLDVNEEATVIAQKDAGMDKSEAIKLPDNYRRLWNKLNSQSLATHYSGVRPYLRVIRKVHQYPREYLISAVLGSPKRILDYVYTVSRKAELQNSA